MEEDYDKVDKSLLNKADSHFEKFLKVKDKSDRATVDQVLDPRTRLFLFGMINKGLIKCMNGCVSTGKEANVYHAVDEDANEYAIKIYKTSILIFKDRDLYVSGEYRFRSGYSKHNPRKMVATWAEKEARNLNRVKAAGIPCPAVVKLHQHILLMQFIGADGIAAPRLKDAAPNLSRGRLFGVYFRLVQIMRNLYQEAHLVHGDLSEYNLLYFKDRLWVIDVSQAVEHEHPQSLNLLKIDCRNVTGYFKRLNIPTLTPQELFDYIILTKEGDLETMKENVKQRGVISDEMMVLDDSYFKTLGEMDLDEAEEMIKKIGSDVEGAKIAEILGIDLTNVEDQEEHSEEESEKSETETKIGPFDPEKWSRDEWIAAKLDEGTLSRSDCDKDEWKDIKLFIKENASMKRASKEAQDKRNARRASKKRKSKFKNV